MSPDNAASSNRAVGVTTKLLAAFATVAMVSSLGALGADARPHPDPETPPSVSTTAPAVVQAAPAQPSVPSTPPTSSVDDPVTSHTNGVLPVPTGQTGAASLAALVADPVTLDSGHVDVVSVRPDGAELELGVKDDTSGGPIVWRDPSSVTFFVSDRAAIAVPDDGAFSFLGAAGRQIWLLPQVQEPDLLWTGWNTEEIPSGFVEGDNLRWRLVGVDGPGAFAIFTTDSFGAPDVIFDSDDAAPDELVLPINVHAHANWAFSAKGTYDITFELGTTLADGGPRTLRATYRFNVVDVTSTAPIPPPTITDASGTDLVAGTAGSTSGGATSAGTGRAIRRPGEPLPPTGSTSATLAAIGVGLVASGVLLLRTTSRRRNSATGR